MSRQKHDTQALPELQEVDLNDASWSEVVANRLPANLEEQARKLKAWSRQRGLRSVSDLLRALLVYVCCQYSWREWGMSFTRRFFGEGGEIAQNGQKKT
jgi:hypothetical protein